jgi:hypothetical protein
VEKGKWGKDREELRGGKGVREREGKEGNGVDSEDRVKGGRGV